MNNNDFINGVNKDTPTNNLNNTPPEPQQPINNVQQPAAPNETTQFNQQLPINNINSEFQNNNPAMQQNINYTSQTTTNNEDLLKAFIGKNYEKITTRPFNFAGFFFTTFYMFYRKMFLYSIILFLINLAIINFTNQFIITILFNIVVGFLVNKIYLHYAKNSIDKIVSKNLTKTNDELINICANKGGTSVGSIFIGFLTELATSFVIFFIMSLMGIGNIIGNLINPSNWNINFTQKKDTVLIEDVTISGYSCFVSNCTVAIGKDNNFENYTLNTNNDDLFASLKDYKDYIKVNIYTNNKTIVDYKIFLKSNNEDITNIENENELRTKIGLYHTGTYTDTFTLTEIGNIGFGFQNDKNYTYINYEFTDSQNKKYEMKYIIPDGSSGLNLTKGNKYTVTFEVVEGTFDYEFNIKSVN